MAFTSTDWTIDYTAKTVTNNDSATGTNLPSATGDYDNVGTVLEFFQWLAAEFAATSQMDDDYAFVSDTPTVYRWVNTWAFGHANDYKYLQGGSIESSDSNELWSNLYSIGTQEAGTQLYIIQNDVEITPWWITGNIDILVNVKTAGSWIQSDNTSGVATNGALWVYAREFGDTYDHNFSDLSGSGRNPVGINTAADSGNKSGELYVTVSDGAGFTVGQFAKDETTGAVGKITKVETNDIYLNAVRGGTITAANSLAEYSERECNTASGTSSTISSVTDVVAGYSDVTDTFGTVSKDLNNGNGSVNYDVVIDAGTRAMSAVYEYLKYIVRYGSAETVNGDAGQEYRSADEGTYTDTKVAPFGTLAGTTMYGARGVWVENYATADFVLTDATGTEQSPPNYQKVAATHTDLAGGESGDGGVTIFVAEITGNGGTLIKDQYTISAAANLSITTDAAIDINKTPQSGTLRVGDTVYTYTSFSGSVFTITGDATGETGDLYVPLLDVTADATSELSDNIIYNADFWVRTVVRRYGTKPYTADTQFGSTGLSFSPILTDDPQAT